MVDRVIIHKNTIDKELKYKEAIEGTLSIISKTNIIQDKALGLCESDFDNEGNNCLAYLMLSKPESEVSKVCIEIKELLKFKEALEYIKEHDFEWLDILLNTLFKLDYKTEHIALTDEGYSVGLKIMYYNEEFDQHWTKRFKRFMRIK